MRSPKYPNFGEDETEIHIGVIAIDSTVESKKSYQTVILTLSPEIRFRKNRLEPAFAPPFLTTASFPF